MTYDEFVLTFVIAVTSFAILMFIIANNGDDDGAV
jgi:hypothetical protein